MHLFKVTNLNKYPPLQNYESAAKSPYGWSIWCVHVSHTKMAANRTRGITSQSPHYLYFSMASGDSESCPKLLCYINVTSERWWSLKTMCLIFSPILKLIYGKFFQMYFINPIFSSGQPYYLYNVFPNLAYNMDTGSEKLLDQQVSTYYQNYNKM